MSVIHELSRTLPKGNVLTGEENTRLFECDGSIRTLMGPGPSDVHPRILSAMARPTIGHLDPAFVGMMNETKEGLKTIFKTENELTMPFINPQLTAT
jgi:hypothetical protein